MDSATSKQVGSRQDGLSYRIKKGDSLASVAVRNWELLQSLEIISKTATKTRPNIEAAAYSLARMNNIPRAELVEPGQVIHFSNPSPQIASPVTLPKDVIKPPVRQEQQQQLPASTNYELPQGGNLSQAARAKWTELQNLGTIPKAWNPANPNHVHLAALRLAKINNIENPNRITSRNLNLAPTSDKVIDDKGQTQSQPTPEKLAPEKQSAEQAKTPVADIPVATEKAQPNTPHTQAPASAPPAHIRPASPTAPPPDSLSAEDALPPQGTQPAIDKDEDTKNKPEHSILFPDQKPDPTAIAKVSEPTIGSYMRPTALNTNENGFVSILLLGKDFDGRPDIIKQVLVDPNSLRTAIIDIPRDLRINRSGNRKLNSLGRKGDDKIVAAVEEITGQSSTYVTSFSLNDIESLKSTFSTLFPEGVTLPSDKRYFDAVSNKLFEPKERITDLSKLGDYMRMRHAYVVSPTWQQGDDLAGQEKLIASDLERQKRQSELMASIKGQLGYTDAGKTLLSLPLNKFFRPENNADVPSKIALATFFGQVATMGEEPGRFQPELLYKYNASGQQVQRATARNPYTSISVDINGLRTDLVKYFSQDSSG